MKKVLYILNDGVRRFTYERISGLYRAIQKVDEPIHLYIVRSEGHQSFTSEHNSGEYNIYRLPDYQDFDGIFLDINSNFNSDSNEECQLGGLYASQAAAASGKPVISLANNIEGFYYVGIDNYGAMTSVIRYLHEDLGLTDFWFVMGPENNYESQMRMAALLDYCRQNELPCGEDRIYSESFNRECGEHAFNRLYALNNGVLPQAIICSNDVIAAEICRMCAKNGYSVPDDVYVTGYDNLELSEFCSPSITTIDQMSWTMGDVCMDTMCRIWRGEAVPSVIYTPHKLILRESTGCMKTENLEQRKNIERIIGYNSDVTEFSYRVNILQYQLPACETIEEICDALRDCVSDTGCTGIRLVLDSELFEHPSDSGKQTMRSLELSDKLCTEGYSDRMDLVYTWEAGKGSREMRLNIGSAIKLFTEENNSENYLFVPLHFMQYTVGYLKITNCVEMIRIKCISSIANTLTMTLRSYFTRNKLFYFNQILSGLSMKDDLTGLYNRLGYNNLAYNLFRKTKEEKGRLAVLFIDIDRLKYINDTFGHRMGDKAIACVARAVLESVPENAVSVRYGGDEFLTLVPAECCREVETLIETIRGRLPSLAETMEMPLTPGFSIGYLLTDSDSECTLDEYVAEADNSMYREKKRHRC